ncbi:MAG TPA: thiamine pyrophosphate-binding protein [Xanthobacteraceae bacterium]
MKNIQDGGEAILEALRGLNVEYVISSPGSEWPSFWEALARQKKSGTPGPAYLDCGHETLAVAMATGYTQVTGRMQAVLLHAGAGLLQGSMAIYGARAMETPMLVMSGESLGYGESEFDPGPQWYRNLNVVGGPQRLVEPVVKAAFQSPSVATLYNSVVRAGELAQRVPQGPTYLCVSMDSMIEEWSKPETARAVAPVPRSQPAAADIANVATLLAKARCPFILVENAGPDPETFEALIALAELLAIPVLDAPGACVSNFPKSHDLYLGLDTTPYLEEMDFALLVENETPWYPPSNSPKNAKIVAIGSCPIKDTLVYQVTGAEHSLEGDVAITLRLLIDALRSMKLDDAAIAARRARWKAQHDRLRQRLEAAESKALAESTITVPLVARLMREAAPDAIYVDETIVHARLIREHINWDEPFGFFRAPSGLGQGMGYALGIKLALPKRPVVVTIGDGTFLYNPVLPALAFADEHKLPLLILVFNNAKYAAMQYYHDKFYPSGTAIAANDYYGVDLKGVKYEQAAATVDGYSSRVETPAELKAALGEALRCLASGKSAIINMIMPGKVR